MKPLLKINEFEKRLIEQNISQTEFAEKIERSGNFISMLKNHSAKNYASPETRRKMCKILKCKFEDIFEVLN